MGLWGLGLWMLLWVYKRRRQNMLGAVELAIQVEPSSDTSDASILYDMADQAVNLAASRAGWQTRTEPPTPRTAFPAPGTSIAPASSCKAAPLPPPPPPPPPPPQDSAGIDCTPTAPPRFAGDALLTTSGQNQHSSLRFRIEGLRFRAVEVRGIRV